MKQLALFKFDPKSLQAGDKVQLNKQGVRYFNDGLTNLLGTDRYTAKTVFIVIQNMGAYIRARVENTDRNRPLTYGFLREYGGE